MRLEIETIIAAPRERCFDLSRDLDRPSHFRDSMIEGRFAHFEHDHYFTDAGGTTLMRDVIDFASPFGWLGRLVDGAFMGAYLRKLIVQRNDVIERAAEI